jgi:NAD(P)-dependent dehydrogenase (short-subunit alcohol dehydrogenase family)
MILQDRIAVATASGSGIGRAGARIMAREGALVVVADRSVEGAEETVELIRATGGQAEAVTTDVTDDAAVRRLIEGTVERHGRIDILHSHAGVQIGGGIEEVEPEGLDLSYQVNVRAHFMLSRATVPHMKVQGGGAILLTSSNAGVVPDYGMLAYLTTKAGLVMMAQQMALDLGKHGIRVNALCPGWVDTPFNAAYIDQVGGRAAVEQLIRGRVPLGRWGTVDDVAEAILYLVSDRSSYMTGQAFVLDGGECLVGAGQEG